MKTNSSGKKYEPTHEQNFKVNKNKLFKMSSTILFNIEPDLTGNHINSKDRIPVKIRCAMLQIKSLHYL
jgi:hypothetical protein